MKKLFIKYLKFNLASLMEYRMNFIIQVLFMFINNILLLFFWWIVFQKTASIKGFGMNEVLLLYSTLTISFGMSLVIFGNQFKLPQIIINGELDSYLMLPKPILLHVLISKMSLAAFGDIVFGIFIFFFTGFATLQNIIILLITGFFGALVLVSLSVIVSSLTFFIGNSGALLSLFTDTAITFSTYPENLFNGVVRVLLYTLFPAGFLTFIPASLILNFNLSTLFLMFFGTAVFILLANFSFYGGLKKYESGNLIVKRM